MTDDASRSPLRAVRQRLGPALVGAGHLTGGAAASQIVAFVTTVGVARLYDPQQVGLFASLVAVATMIAPLATLGLSVAIVPADTDPDAARLARLGLLSTAICAVLTAVALATLPTPDGVLREHRALAAVFVPLIILVLGSFAVLSQIALRQRLYGAIAARGLVQNVTIGVVQIVGRFAAPGALGLFIGELAGRVVGVLTLIPPARRFARQSGPDLPAAKTVVTRYRGAVYHFLPATLMETASLQLTLVLVAAWFGATTAGYLSLAWRVLYVPSALLGTALGQVLNTELSRRRYADDAGRSKKRLGQLLLGLTGVSIVFATTVAALGPWLFGLVFGQEWREAGELARFVAMPMAVGLVWNPVSVVFGAFLKFGTFMALSAARLGATVGVGAALHALGVSWIAVVVGMAAATALVQIVGIWLAWRIVAGQPSASVPPSQSGNAAMPPEHSEGPS